MTDVRRWELLADAAAVDDRLPDGDVRFVDELDHPDAQTERHVYEALAELGRPDAATQEDLAVARSMLVARRRAGRRPWGIGIAVAAAAAILVVAIGVPTAISWTRDEGAGPSAGGLLTDVDASEAEVRDAERGRAVRGDRGAPPQEVVPEEPEVDELQILDEDVAAPEDPPEVERAKPLRSAEPPPTAGELLAKARKLVAAGSGGKALAVYEKLRRAHPSSSEAHVANVSIGEIQLQRGKASAALAAFDRYLSGGGGSLREEALWGRVRALHRLGRVEARDEAAERLKKTFPKSVYLSRLPK